MKEDEVVEILDRIRLQAATGKYCITLGTHEEMFEEAVSLEEVLEGLRRGLVLEYYPKHKRGACCLVSGKTGHGRHLHFLCTTSQPLLILMAVYEPRSPEWVTPRQRGIPV